MPLNHEPGRIQLRLEMSAGTSASIALETASEFEQAPIFMNFSGTDCSTGPEVYIRYSINSENFHYKYFKAPHIWQNELSIVIDWDEKGHTLISVDNEKISVQPSTTFKAFKFRSRSGKASIKELTYSGSTETASARNGTPQ